MVIYMLTLSRKKGESIICILEDGREIKVIISQVKGNQVSLSFDADETIDIYRDELLLDESKNRQSFIDE